MSVKAPTKIKTLCQFLSKNEMELLKNETQDGSISNSAINDSGDSGWMSLLIFGAIEKMENVQVIVETKEDIHPGDEYAVRERLVKMKNSV